MQYPNYHTLLFCDLDGTLISRYQPLSPTNSTMIRHLAEAGVGVIAASGRCPRLLHAVLAPDLPLAAAICSTGAGILDWRTQAFLQKQELTAPQAEKAVAYLCQMKCNFTLQNPLPQNHLGQFYAGRPESEGRADFFNRLRKTPEAFTPLTEENTGGPAAQLLAVFDRQELPLVEQIQNDLKEYYSLVRATSPVDGRSIWLEFFAPGVSKAAAAEWLKQKLAPNARCLALGNDYNDCDLTEWADDARMASTAPESLQKKYGVIAAEPEYILTEAARLWQLLPPDTL